MDKKSSTRFFCLLNLGIFLSFWPAFSAQPAETAPFFSSVRSFNNNGDAFVAEFRNGMKVIVEESFGVPLAVMTAVVTSGSTGDYLDPGIEGALLASVEPEILALGGIASSKAGRNLILIKTVVPAEEIERTVEILANINSFKTSAAAPESQASDVKENKAGTALDLSGILELALESVSQNQEKPAAGNVKKEAIVGVGGLAVVGSVKHEEVLNYITEYFPVKSGGTLNTLPAHKLEFDMETAGSTLEYERSGTELDFPVFTVTYRIPPENHPQRLSVEVLGKMIGGGLASLLRVSEEQYALNFQHRIDIMDLESASFLVVTVASHPDYLDKAEILVLSTLSMLGKSDLPGTLVTRAKSLYLVDYFRELESQQSRADNWAAQLARGEIRNRAQTAEKLRDLSASDLKTAGAVYFDSGRAFIREFIPAGFSRGFTPEAFRETVSILLPLAMSAFEKRLEKLAYNEPEILFSIPEMVTAAVPSDLKKSSVLRGPDIYIYEIHNSPLVEVGVFYAGGFTDENLVDAGITENLISSMLQRWSNDGMDRQIVSLEGKGCSVQGIVRPDYFGFRATVLSSNFEACFAELIRMITQFPVEDSMVFDYRNSRKFSAFLENAGAPAETVQGIIPLESGLNYPGRESSAATPEKPTALTSWYGRISGSHPEVVIYGDVKGTAFLRRMVPLLSNSSLRKHIIPEGRNRGTKKTAPLVITSGDTGYCRFVTSGLHGNSGLGESLRIISRAQDGSGISVDWIILVENGFGIVTYRPSPEDSEAGCNPGIILDKIRKKKFSTREFNQAKVRAITSYHAETEDPFLMLNAVTVGLLSGERGDFIRQHLVDLIQVRVVEAESVLETLFGE